MKLKWSDLLSLGAVGAVGALAWYLYPTFPERVPTHWNLAGEIDGYMRKPLAVLAMIALPLAGYAVGLLFNKVLPRISPAGFEMDRFENVTDIITLSLTLMLAGVAAVVLLAASGRDVPVITVVTLLTGGLLVVIGNYLGKVRRNFFVGIRTPWTLASDEVWARTHRVGGWLFVLAGIAIIASAGRSRLVLPLVLLSSVGTAALIAVAYSYLVYRQLHR
ncbi:MAG TPA: SdpI family protein [Gammaproteobacteria bacterium]